MILSYRDGTPYTKEDVLKKADGGGTYYIDTYVTPGLEIPYTDEYIPPMTLHRGLTTFLKALSMPIGASKSYTPLAICELLYTFGPLGFVIYVGGPITHAIVVYGIDFDPITNECMVIYHDSVDGSALSMPFATFDKQYGGAASGLVNVYYAA
jgi:hypothetical protein